uniref:Mitochondrial ribosomal protein S9 n=1 Tax=Petromyzon marinus TaxID=7757 RepID=S4RUZ0_PETMA
SEEFLAQQLRDYELGRRHLANMMGEDEESFTQEHIDKAIEYLFPSGLFEKRARPIMKVLEQIIPAMKIVIQWGEDGRPFHYLFYTGKPNYYSLQDLYSQLLQVEAEEDKMRSKAVRRALPSSRWVTQEELEQSLNEQLSEHDVRVPTPPPLALSPCIVGSQSLLLALSPCIVGSQSLPLALSPCIVGSQSLPPLRSRRALWVHSPSPLLSRRAFWVHSPSPLRSRRALWVHSPSPLLSRRALMQLMFPLQFAGRLGAHDAECEVSGVGSSAQAGAVRHALALALTTFLEPHLIEGMRRAGLLTKDQRTKERKKPGQEGARRKFTWKKR